jgi:hypothetical protein
MRPTETIESALKKMNFTAGIELRKQILADALKAHEQTGTQPVFEKPNIWRILMRSRITKISAATVITIAVILGLNLLFGQGAKSAYAVEQTIKAIKEIKTVHMVGQFYKQGNFQCWMKFDGDPDKPTHMWLGLPKKPLCKICSPKGAFILNKQTKAVYFAERNEIGRKWIIKFGSFFENAVKQAENAEPINIYTETDPDTQKEVIVIHINTDKREQKFLVDPKTKLPISFWTIREDAPMEMMRKTLAVKNLEYISYNEQPPDGIFDMPADANIVESEIDCIVDPDSGLVADNMSRQEACLEIVRQTVNALIELDIPKLKSLNLYYRIYPDWMWDKLTAMKQNDQWIDEIPITGNAYHQGELWYVPCRIVYPNGKTETTTPMIKFYEMKGSLRCFIVGSKEKGAVD